MGAESVVLSLGSRGAVGAYPDGLIEALPPRVDALCPIGAGDALFSTLVFPRFLDLRAEAMKAKGNDLEAAKASSTYSKFKGDLPDIFAPK